MKEAITKLAKIILAAEGFEPTTKAYESFGVRSELLLELPKLMEFKHKTGDGVRHLFEDVELGPPPVDKVNSDDRKANMMVEGELLSLNLSAHPMDFCALDDRVTRMKDLHSIPRGKTVKIAGSVIRYQAPPTRNDNRVVYVIMEDGTGVADVTLFGGVQEKCGQVLFRKGWLTARGKVQRRGPKALSIYC